MFADLLAPEQSIHFTVKRGDGIRSVAKQLKQQSLIEFPELLLIGTRLFANKTTIKVGEYHLTGPLSVSGFLDKLHKGKVIQYSFTIVEGWTFKQLLIALHEDKHLEHNLRGKTDTEIMQLLGHADQLPEGRFLADTYFFPKHYNELQFLQRSYQAMDNYLQKQWPERQTNLPLKSPYEALILASIIERETAQVIERPHISSVFIRRLNKGMLLQTDPTVIYGMGDKYKGNIKRRHLREDTPFNTYTRKGLTPTPIALPGRAAILAAMHPSNDKDLYFVAKGNGYHQFSTNLKAHNKAVYEYQIKARRSKK